jgi:hypothetical protein
MMEKAEWGEKEQKTLDVNKIDLSTRFVYDEDGFYMPAATLNLI